MAAFVLIYMYSGSLILWLFCRPSVVVKLSDNAIFHIKASHPVYLKTNFFRPTVDRRRPRPASSREETPFVSTMILHHVSLAPLGRTAAAEIISRSEIVQCNAKEGLIRPGENVNLPLSLTEEEDTHTIKRIIQSKLYLSSKLGFENAFFLYCVAFL